MHLRCMTLFGLCAQDYFSRAGHELLDWLGFIFDPADVINFLWYTAEGNTAMAAATAVAIVPAAGSFIAKGTKQAIKAGKKAAQKAGEKAAKNATEKAAKKAAKKKLAKEAGKEAAEKGAEKAAKEAAEKATEKTAKETAEKTAKEAAEKGGKSGSKSSTPGFDDWLKKGSADNKVYFGVKDDIPQYTGITKQTLDARLSQHNANGKGFDNLNIQYEGLPRNQARAIEQYYIENGPNALNKINSISPNNKYYQDAMNWAKQYLGVK